MLSSNQHSITTSKQFSEKEYYQYFIYSFYKCPTKPIEEKSPFSQVSESRNKPARSSSGNVYM